MKDNNFYSLYATSPDTCTPNPDKYDNQDDYLKDYARFINRVSKETKQICPTCKHIFDKVFEFRLIRLSELNEELMNIYKMPPKDLLKDKKNDKKKK
jgi:hypothetical protein